MTLPGEHFLRHPTGKWPVVGVAWLAVMGAILNVIVVLAPSAGAQDGSSAQGTPSIELVSQSIWMAEADQFQMSLRLTDVPDQSSVDLIVGLPIRSRSAFLDRLAEPATGLVLHQISRQPIPEPDENGVTSLQVPTLASQIPETGAPDQTMLWLPEEGVYPLSIVLRDADGVRLETIHTFLVRLPPPDANHPPLLVSTVLSVSGPPAVSPMGDVDLGSTILSLQTLADVLNPEIRPQALVTVSIDPHLIDALALSDQPEHAQLLTRLQQATVNRQLASNTYAPIDSDAWIDQGLSLEIGWQIEAGSAALAEFLQTLPDPSIMVLTTSASSELLQRLQRERVELVLVPDSLLDPADEPTSSAAKTSFLLPASGEPLKALSIDSTVVAHFSNATASPYLVLADLAVRWFEDPQQIRGIVLAPPLGPPSDSIGLGILIDEISASPILSPVSPAGIVESLEPRTLRQVLPAGENGFGEDYQAALSDGQRIARSYQNMVDPIATEGTPEHQLIETLGRALLLSGTYGLTETERDAYLGVVAQTVRDTVAAIQPPSRQRITLTSRSESIPMLIRNSLNHDVIVRLDLNSDKLEFPDGDSLLRRLSPGVNQVQVPVQAKTSGDAVLEVSVNSPTGLLALGESQLTVRATSLSGAGVGIATAALAILMLWWARSWWSRHRSKTQPSE